MELSSVIIKPYRTEKTYLMATRELKTYAFIVHKKSSKTLIAKAFWEIYGIHPRAVNVLIKKPTRVKTGTKNPGWSKLAKIAYISLPAGIDISEEEKE